MELPHYDVSVTSNRIYPKCTILLSGDCLDFLITQLYLIYLFLSVCFVSLIIYQKYVYIHIKYHYSTSKTNHFNFGC